MHSIPILYCDGFNGHVLGGKKSPLRKKFNAIIKYLKENKHTSLGDIKLISGDGGIKYFRAKLSDSDRLLFTSIKYKGKDVFVILEVILNHDYHKSKFLTNKEKIKNIKIIDQNNKEVFDNAGTVGIGDAPQIRLLSGFITLSETQEGIVNRAKECRLPLIIHGAAGSGKTSAAVASLKEMLKKFRGKRILYVTRSKLLAEELRKLFEYEHYNKATGELEIHTPEEIDFLSVHEFFETITKNVKGKKPIDRSKFFSWFNEICKKDPFKKYKKDGDKIFEEFTAVIAGRGLLGKDQYVNLGKRQSIFLKEERKIIYGLFFKYKEFIEKDPECYDPNLIAHECVEKVQANKVYSVIVADEVQDLTEIMVSLVLKSLTGESEDNFAFFGDVNQVIYPSFFSLSRLKSFLYENTANKELPVCVLEKNYRNSKQVIELANRILHFKNYCFASEDKITTDEEKKAFFMKSDTENTGNVSFIAEGKEQEIAEKVSGSTSWAVLVLDDESKEDARKLFNTPLVFTIHEAKGLEFKNVVLYKFDEAYKKVWNAACQGKSNGEIENIINEIRRSYEAEDVNLSRPKYKEDKSFEELKFYVNALYVAATRAINGVYIMGNKEKYNLLKVIAPEEKVSVDIKKEESSPEAWKNMALELIDKGNIEQAKDIAVKLLEKGEKKYATDIAKRLAEGREQGCVKEIIMCMKAKGYHAEVEETDNVLQSSLDRDGKDELGQATKSLSELEIDKENSTSQSPQKSSMGGTKSKVPTKNSDQKEDKKRAAKRNQNQKKNPKVSEKNTKELFSASKNGEVQSAENLIKLGVDVNAKDEEDCTPLHWAAHNGHDKVVELLLEYGADIEAKGSNGLTPLHFAAQNDHKDVIKLLLQYKANVDAKTQEGFTPLHFAAQNNHKDVIKLLLKSKANVNDKVQQDDHKVKVNKAREDCTPLHVAAHNGHKDVVKLLLDSGAEVDARSGEGLTPLYLAAKNGHKDVVKLLLLLKYKAEVDARGEEGFTPLHVAAQDGHDKVVKLLLDSGADVNDRIKEGLTPLQRGAEVNARIKEGLTPLYLAAQDGHDKVVKLLLDHKAEIDARSGEGFAPLHVAAHNGYKNVVDLLLKYEAEVNAKTSDDCTPLHLAAQNGHDEVVELLLKSKQYKAEVNAKTSDGCTPLHLAAQDGHKDVVKLLLDSGADIEAKGSNGLTPLYLAAQDGHKDVVKLLLDSGADIEAKGSNGLTPLYLAAQDGKEDAVKLLLQYKAKVDARSGKGFAPLHVAAQNGHDKVVDLLLLQREADINAKASDDYTPLHLAAQDGKKDVVKLLLERKANFNAKTQEGFTPLYLAAKNGRDKVVKLLLDSGADVNDRIKEGLTPLQRGANVNAKVQVDHTPLHVAAQDGHEAKVNANKAREGCTPLHVAAHNGHKDAVKLLLDSGSDIEAIDIDGKTPLSYVTDDSVKNILESTQELFTNVRSNNPQEVKNCINRQASIGATDKGGFTPLYIASLKGYEEIVNLLLEKGADATRVTSKGNTPLHIASLKGYGEIVEILLKHVAQTSYDKLSNFINARTTTKGTTSLHVAAKNGSLDVVKSLLKHGAIYNIENEEGKTPLNLSQGQNVTNVLKLVEELFEDAKNGNLEIISKLKAVNPDEFMAVTNARNNQGKSLFQVVIINKHKNVARKLLEILKGPDPNVQDVSVSVEDRVKSLKL